MFNLKLCLYSFFLFFSQGILVQVRSEIMSDANAQLDDVNANRPYSEDEARRAFARMVQRYGWNNWHCTIICDSQMWL